MEDFKYNFYFCKQVNNRFSFNYSPRFTKQDLRLLYRGFKNECPSGMLSEECFHNVYTSYFPGRDETYNGIPTNNCIFQFFFKSN